MTDTTFASEPVQLGRRKKAEPKKQRKLAIICSKGSLDMAYPPLILANAARMSGIEAHLFFTFWGMDVITKSKMEHLHVATVGNPNMHPSFHIPTLVGVLPGMSLMASEMMRREIARLDFPPVPEFLELLHDAGAHIYACQMAMDMMKLKPEDLVPYAEVLGAMEFLEIADEAQILFV
ncbi:MAG: DsrE/DsrF/DrsH-like family protein [Anaerolineae bacterium]|jgi:peroxiredoxin family protein|nr:DsrE/DsrF/DrsH-like family protein [Anaerolineae bacterium]